VIAEWMADLTERVADGASPETEGRLEWLPSEIEAELGKPRFTRLTTVERIHRRDEDRPPSVPIRTRRFAPSAVASEPQPPAQEDRPSATSEMLRRLSEAEATVASAASEVDRSASNVRRLVEGNEDSG
jgi:hypothetical protein